MLHNSIIEITKTLQAEFGLTPIVASEIEFYLHGGAPDENFWAALVDACKQESIPLLKYEKEKGEKQYEIALAPTSAQKCANDTKLVKQLISDLAIKNNMKADFSAKPLVEQPGSGLHINVHLENDAGKNVFYKKDDIISDTLKFSIGGLLDRLPASMYIFAPSESSYARFTDKSNAPTTISWGANNRTVAIRLPDSAPDKKRIEHRVAGADAHPDAVIVAILAGIHHGLTNRISPPPQIYGDASLEMYNLQKLPQSLVEASKLIKHA
ncbi:MAG: glutamine synthetase [Alphaproteobacteria bacterium]